MFISVQAGEKQRGRRKPFERQVLQEDSFLPHHHAQRVFQAGLWLQRRASSRVQPRAQPQLGEDAVPKRNLFSGMRKKQLASKIAFLFLSRWLTQWTAVCSQQWEKSLTLWDPSCGTLSTRRSTCRVVTFTGRCWDQLTLQSEPCGVE